MNQFKRDELAFELRHEDAALGVYNKYNTKRQPAYLATVYIDGKAWKQMPLRSAMAAVTTLKSKGKDARYV